LEDKGPREPARFRRHLDRAEQAGAGRTVDGYTRDPPERAERTEPSAGWIVQQPIIGRPGRIVQKVRPVLRAGELGPAGGIEKRGAAAGALLPHGEQPAAGPARRRRRIVEPLHDQIGAGPGEMPRDGFIPRGRHAFNLLRRHVHRHVPQQGQDQDNQHCADERGASFGLSLRHDVLLE
jgi:hypothetical protein